MKRNLNFISSVIQIIIGIAAILSFVILKVNAEAGGQWTITLILAVVLIITGIIGIILDKK